MTTTTDTPTPTTTSPWSSRWVAGGAALLLVLAILCGWLVLFPASPGSPRVLSGPQRCGPAGGSQTLPVTAPPATWHPFGLMTAPSSPAAGPARTVNRIPGCFSPDPVGALFAAATFVAGCSTVDVRPTTIRQMVAPGPGKDRALRAERPGTPDPADTTGQIAGFRFDAYTTGQARIGIEMAITTALGSDYVNVPVQLVWQAGDWRVVIPDTPEPFQVSVVTNLGDYVNW